MKYNVVLHESEEGIAVFCPALPGCWSQGETEAEAVENIQDAIQDYLAAVNPQVNEGRVREVEVAGINDYIAEMQQVNQRMDKRQIEIDTLKTETRAILSQIHKLMAA